ncbi:alanine--tRNA ligase [Vulcanibacillus modesticaldus]|uniref:Alanine--tRNA ligase n=1 Tax=Vulcanibacillus modesticaldus TaxID=337097 RepID=A0A1D2YTC6_9BACI|nr:alanine--tRNA ligase [Vulcanibacillus modesticaldus]OEF98915.1 alanine--tRNA ligase [Vulcanibacillus modesticaldus]
MRKMSSHEIRKAFLDFFKSKGHKVEPSASLIPYDDPSLLWINSGVATLKPYFDGRKIPDNPRITNSQKSIRTNDIENVGKTARHHTFFEMLGNFSIGDYFKKEAIHWAWEFLTDEKWIGFDPEKLSVTIHPEDDEAYKIWHDEIGIPDERIIRLEENFWDIGEGPSGPNTEIFYDRGEKYCDPSDPECYPGGENERYLEIWNLVFSQYNHNPDGSYTPLPKKNIDTGMGLERMASVIQGVETNFDTDLFIPIIETTAEHAGVKYHQDKNTDVALKVIADHIRTIVFAIGDGALPSNEGRGYIIRRLLRRAVRYGKTIGIEKPFLYRLTSVVGEIMKDYYPEILEKREFIEKVIRTEEERFHETLSEGLAILAQMIEKAQEEGRKEITGQEAFKLYDTYGFPLDLTEDFASENGLTVDQQGFEIQMEEQRSRARSARQEIDSMKVQGGILGEIKEESEFVGYNELMVDTKITHMIDDEQLVEMASKGRKLQVILDKTPFYAESGGQIADRGNIVGRNGEMMKVLDVIKAPNGQHLHHVEVVNGTFRVGDEATAEVDTVTRGDIIKNHTATHILHQALKDILGQHVNQAGSLVAPDRLRFDFSHFGAITEDELATIEEKVNQQIWANQKVNIMIKSLEEAKKMGAMALFGEKYGEEVRIVQVGEYSLELCGGCHVGNSAEIGLFKIISESSIGAGIRRIEAVTGKWAYQFLNEQFTTLKQLANELKTKPLDVPQKVESLQMTIKELQRENESLKAKISSIEAKDLINKVETIEGINVLRAKLAPMDMDNLRKIVDDLKVKMESGIILVSTVNNNKVNLVAYVTEDLIKQGFHAGKLIKGAASRVGGGGGGRPDMAQAGGKEPEKVQDALDYVTEYVKSVKIEV